MNKRAAFVKKAKENMRLGQEINELAVSVCQKWHSLADKFDDANKRGIKKLEEFSLQHVDLASDMVDLIKEVQSTAKDFTEATMKVYADVTTDYKKADPSLLPDSRKVRQTMKSLDAKKIRIMAMDRALDVN